MSFFDSIKGMILPQLKLSKERELFLYFLTITIFAFILRNVLFPFESDDLRSYKIWFQYLHDHGGLAALGDQFYNYNPPYLYLLALVSYLPRWIPDAYLIKAVSIPFEVLTAFFAAKIILRNGASTKVAVLLYFVLLFLPTVLLNGSFWGQCDSIFTSFIVMSVYFLTINRPALAIITFAVSVSFKLQAMVFAPALFCYFITQRIKIKDLLWAPVIFLALLIPAIIFGRGFWSVLQTYPAQAEYFRNLNLNAPNFYIWISDGDLYRWLPDTLFFIIKPAGYLLTMLFALLLACLVRFRESPISVRVAINIAFVSCLVTPYFLPMMHERYFYPGEILSIIWVFINPRFFVVPCLIQAASIHTYLNYLYAKGFLTHAELFNRIEVAAILMTIAVVISFYVLCKSLFEGNNSTDNSNNLEVDDSGANLRGTDIFGISTVKWLSTYSVIFLFFIIFLIFNHHPSSVASRIKLPVTVSAITDSTGLKEIQFVGHLSAIKFSQTWGVPRYDSDIRGYPLLVNKKQYRYGVCSHSNSNIEFNLDQKYSKFFGKVGFPDYLGANTLGSVVFEVVADGQVLWRSDIQKPKSVLSSFEVSVVNVKTLELKMSDGGDGMNSDHGCWLETSVTPLG